LAHLPRHVTLSPQAARRGKKSRPFLRNGKIRKRPKAVQDDATKGEATITTTGIDHRGLAAATLAFGLAIAALAGVFLNSEPLFAGGSPAAAYQKDKDGLLVPRMAYPRLSPTNRKEAGE
jgi:hypothetical protein